MMDCLIFHQKDLMKKYGYVGRGEKRKSGFGMERTKDSEEENRYQLKALIMKMT